jgi:hypothetical protein
MPPKNARANKQAGVAKKTKAGGSKKKTPGSKASLVDPDGRPRRDEVRYPIRRILAQRPPRRGTKEQGQQYLVDWYPGWDSALNISHQPLVLADWAKLKEDDKHTFTLDNTTVMRCSNPTEDTSAKQCRLMLDTVLNQFKKWLKRPIDTVAREIFHEADWAFTSDAEEERAADYARYNNETAPSAAEVLRRFYTEMRNSNAQSIAAALLHYADIELHYLGQVDTSIPNIAPDRRKDRKRATVTTHLQPLFEPLLTSMRPELWKTAADKHANLHALARVAHNIYTRAQFVLKKPWPMLFCRLFATSDDMVKEWRTGAIKMRFQVSEGWEDRTRDYFLQWYLRECVWEMRNVECLERTYLELRDRVGATVRDVEGRMEDDEDSVEEESEEEE